MNKIHKVYDYIGPDGNLQLKRFNAEKTIDVIIAALNESQEPKALEEKEEWTLNLGAREIKRDYPEETAGFNLDQIAEMYSEWSEENYCAGWMAPCKEYIERCFKAKPQDEPKCCENCCNLTFIMKDHPCPCHQESETGWQEIWNNLTPWEKEQFKKLKSLEK